MSNMAIWDAVCRTNPENTKHVAQRGGFTAINANSQIMAATKQFGPVGIGWGYVNGAPIFEAGMVIIPVTLWHGKRDNTFGPVYGAEEVAPKGRLDTDAPKKAATDGLTKLLSHLGFNADVFLGRFDDQKYVEQITKEFAPKVECITPDQWDELGRLASAAEVTSEDVLKGAKVAKWEDITAAKFEPLKARLTKKIEELRKDIGQ